MAYDYVGTLRDLASSLNIEFDRMFNRRGLPGRVGIMLNEFSHLDEKAGMKLVADACNENFAMLAVGNKNKIKRINVPRPLRESFQTMLDDVRATCAANFDAMR